MTFPAYPEYKDSGVDWIGEIPKHWKFSRIKCVASLNNGVLPESTDPDSEITYVDIGSVSLNNGIERVENFQFKDAPSRARKLVQDGDVIVSTVRTYLKAIAPIVKPQENLVVSTGFAVIRGLDDLSPLFAKYAFQSDSFVDEVISRSTGVSYPAINASEIGLIKIPIPSKIEQIKIANFLEQEIPRIDSLIAEQEQLIELLNEKRQSIISNAVCRGLDPNVPLKDSHVEWLGLVPKDWQLEKIGSVATVEGGGTPSKDNLEYWNGEIPWVSPKDMKLDEITTTEDCITQSALASSASKLIPVNSVLMVVRSGILKHTIPVAINAVPVTLNQDMKAFNFRIKGMNEFFFHFVNGMNDGLLHAWSKQGATVESLETNLILKTLLPIPKPDEIKSINKFIWSVKLQFQELIDTSMLAITQLVERRSALISAAVTGQIDVRNFQPRS
jgi:type I restriction enzyme, S subunit